MSPSCNTNHSTIPDGTPESRRSRRHKRNRDHTAPQHSRRRTQLPGPRNSLHDARRTATSRWPDEPRRQGRCRHLGRITPPHRPTDWTKKTQQAHDEIWAFHQELKKQGIRHIFVNGNTDFSKITKQKKWGTDYIGPYDPTQTYDAIIRAKGIQTVAPNSYHFGKDGHSIFHRFMLQYIIANKYI